VTWRSKRSATRSAAPAVWSGSILRPSAMRRAASPPRTQNGLFESLNGRFRFECLNEHLFVSGKETPSGGGGEQSSIGSGHDELL
jgi:hypothetical protein